MKLHLVQLILAAGMFAASAQAEDLNVTFENIPYLSLQDGVDTDGTARNHWPWKGLNDDGTAYDRFGGKGPDYNRPATTDDPDLEALTQHRTVTTRLDPVLLSPQ